MIVPSSICRLLGPSCPTLAGSASRWWACLGNDDNTVRGLTLKLSSRVRLKFCKLSRRGAVSGYEGPERGAEGRDRLGPLGDA